MTRYKTPEYGVGALMGFRNHSINMPRCWQLDTNTTCFHCGQNVTIYTKWSTQSIISSMQNTAFT